MKTLREVQEVQSEYVEEEFRALLEKLKQLYSEVKFEKHIPAGYEKCFNGKRSMKE